MSSKKYTLTVNVDYVDGHIRHGYRKMELTESQLTEFKKMTEREQENWFDEGGETIVTDCEVNGYGAYDIHSLEVREESE